MEETYYKMLNVKDMFGQCKQEAYSVKIKMFIPH